MYRLIMPRVFELVDLVSHKSAEFAYFQNFESSIYEYPEKKLSWLLREKSFQRLDSNAWELLKEEAKPYLINNSLNTRGHQQLFDILNQAFAFEYLQDQGFFDIEFIQRAKKKVETPDLKASTLNGTVLCEVKSINLSEEEVNRRIDGRVGSSRVHLDQGFFDKFDSDIKKAEKQMMAYDQSNNIARIVFIIPNFDDSLAEYKVEYYEQIDHHLSQSSLALSVVFYNIQNVFKHFISMRNAEIVNQKLKFVLWD